MDGQTGRIHWMRDQMYRKGTPALADVNGDGYAEVLLSPRVSAPLPFEGLQVKMSGKPMYIWTIPIRRSQYWI